MFIAVYEFKVKPGKEKEFEQSWAVVTDAIAKHRGERKNKSSYGVY